MLGLWDCRERLASQGQQGHLVHEASLEPREILVQVGPLALRDQLASPVQQDTQVPLDQRVSLAVRDPVVKQEAWVSRVRLDCQGQWVSLELLALSARLAPLGHLVALGQPDNLDLRANRVPQAKPDQLDSPVRLVQLESVDSRVPAGSLDFPEELVPLDRLEHRDQRVRQVLLEPLVQREPQVQLE